MVEVREAVREDAVAMSEVLRKILTLWNSDRPSSPEHVAGHYIEHPNRVRCSVALDEAGRVIGFQSLQAAGEGNPYDLPVGHAMIGTYVDTDAARKGVGRALFAASLEAARKAGIDKIDATIGAENAKGLAYYEALGFRTYRTGSGSISKIFHVQ